MSKNQYRCSSFCSFFKGEKFIQKYLENMLEQTIFSEVEFIFVNCNSPENEEQYLLPIVQKYDNIKYIKLDVDPGLYAAWNIAIKETSSDIITNWNIDDRKTKNSLEILVTELETDESLDMVYGHLAMSTIPNETYEQNPKNEWFKIQHPSLVNYLIHNSPHCMPMWKKRIHDYCGYFTESYDCVSDAEIWLKLIINKGKIKALDTDIGVYYFNPEGRSSDKTRMLANYKEAVHMKNNIIHSMGCGSFGIDDLLTCEKNDEFYALYNDKIKHGMSHIKNTQLIFSGLCRNSGPKLTNRIDYLIEQMKKYCDNFQVVLFENDSTDETKFILRDLATKYNNFHYVSTDINAPQYGPVKNQDRIKKMAFYRTELQTYIKNKFHKYDYNITFDTDFIDISIDGLLNSFGWLANNDKINAMAGYSYTFKEDHGNYIFWNYDSWAYRQNGWTDVITQPKYPFVQRYNTMLSFGLSVLPKGSIPITVYSAFGGSAIYRMADYLSGTYGDYDCEHVTFHRSLKDKDPAFQLCANPSQIMLLSE